MFKLTSPNRALLKCYIKPNSSKSCISGVLEDRLVINLSSPAVENKANKELLSLIKKELKCKVEIVKGLNSRFKTVELQGENVHGILNLIESKESIDM